MASIRRTLSPVPRSGASLNGEMSLVASPLSKSSSSPLSKSSSSPQNYSPSSGLSSMMTSLDTQALFGGVFWPKSSRSLEKAKPKGQLWRKMLFHFFLSFMVGVLIGLTPFASSKDQVFRFEEISKVQNFQLVDNITRKLVDLEVENLTGNATNVIDLEVENLTGNATNVMEMKLAYHISKGNNQSLVQDPNPEFQKLLIIVTPTSAGPFQAYYLNRMTQVIKLVEPLILWIVVEMNCQSDGTADILRKSGVTYRHLVCNENITGGRDEKIHQRNTALSHIETHHLDGIVYFADESNIYSAGLFEQIRQIRRFGTWTVAKLRVNEGKAILEGPICNGTQVIGWKIDDPRVRFRRFHVEISGFAFNSTILWDAKRWGRPTLEPVRRIDSINDEYHVSKFVEQIVEDESQMEGLLQDCSKISVWNLHLESSNLLHSTKPVTGK